MPTLSEFILTIGRWRDAGENQIWTYFQFETLREFRSFRYEVDVDESFDPLKRTISFLVKGMQAPSTLMASTGSAKSEFTYSNLNGEYTVVIGGAKKTGSFRIQVSSKGLIVLDAIDSDFVQVRLHDVVEKRGE